MLINLKSIIALKYFKCHLLYLRINKIYIIELIIRKIIYKNLLLFNSYSIMRIISRSLLIIEKIISFLVTALMANILSYSDIGFWSQVLFSSLYLLL